MNIYPSCFPSNITAFTTLAPLSFKEGTEEGSAAKLSLEKELSPNLPIWWLTQVHGNNVLALPLEGSLEPADAVFTTQKGIVCAVRTADCLPLLFSSLDGSIIAATHAGWRGLHAEIIKETILRMNYDPAKLLVWLGPAICQKHFEVGEEVFEQFVSLDEMNRNAFIKTDNSKYLADLYAIARLQLSKAGVPLENISGGEYCTFHDERFHSYRRDGEKSGRIVSCIMIK